MDVTEYKTGNKYVTESCRNLKIVTRPKASNGFWLAGLIFMSHAVNVWNRDNHVVELNYKRATIISFGLLLHSALIFISMSTGKFLHSVGRQLNTLLCIGITSFLLWICLKDNVAISMVSAILGIGLFDFSFFRLLKRMPKSFTLGEAAIVSQGFTIFMYYAFLKLPKVMLEAEPLKFSNVMHLTTQIILLGIGIVIVSCHMLPFLRKTVLFYLTTITVASCTAFVPIFGQSTIIVLFRFILSDPNRMLVITLYVTLLIVASFFVIWQINRQTSANTITRKMFHLIMVFVYLPGLWTQCTLLYVVSGLMLGLLLMLETARAIQLRPIYQSLDMAVRCFIDEKDAGLVALTPIYLLVGCSLPMWLHPVPCDLTDSVGLNLMKLLSGILSVGIGDTMASICGYLFGKHKWPGTTKSVEGTLASILGQTGVVFLLYRLSFIHMSTLRAATTGAAIIINSLVEAKTSQVDNLVLPLVTYIVLGTA